MIRVDLILDQQLELALVPPGAYYVEGILHRVDEFGSVVDCTTSRYSRSESTAAAFG